MVVLHVAILGDCLDHLVKKLVCQLFLVSYVQKMGWARDLEERHYILVHKNFWRQSCNWS